MSKVDHIIWHRCEDELPKTSGEYLVSRYGFMYDTNISDFRIYQNKDFRYSAVSDRHQNVRQ